MRKGETKYTELYVIRELKSFLRIMDKNKDIIYQGQLLKKKKYSKEFVAEMLQKYKDSETIKSIHQRIKTILETRAVEYGLRLGNAAANKTNAAFFIFFMKNAYNWKDNNTIDHNINLPTPILANKEALKASTKKFIKAGTAYVEDKTENSDTSIDRVGDKAEAER